VAGVGAATGGGALATVRWRRMLSPNATSRGERDSAFTMSI
jgi:hypothetical protein